MKRSHAAPSPRQNPGAPRKRSLLGRFHDHLPAQNQSAAAGFRWSDLLGRCWPQACPHLLTGLQHQVPHDAGPMRPQPSPRHRLTQGTTDIKGHRHTVGGPFFYRTESPIMYVHDLAMRTASLTRYWISPVACNSVTLTFNKGETNVCIVYRLGI